MYRDDLGVEHKSYKDYVEQAQGRDRVYKLFLDNKYFRNDSDFTDYYKNRMWKDEDN